VRASLVTDCFVLGFGCGVWFLFAWWRGVPPGVPGVGQGMLPFGRRMQADERNTSAVVTYARHQLTRVRADARPWL
jgi:hypothetical protein